MDTLITFVSEKGGGRNNNNSSNDNNNNNNCNKLINYNAAHTVKEIWNRPNNSNGIA